jgi:hypothetical protein
MGIWLGNPITRKKGGTDMNNIFYIVGVIVVVLFIAGYFGLRKPRSFARDVPDTFQNCLIVDGIPSRVSIL